MSIYGRGHMLCLIACMLLTLVSVDSNRVRAEENALALDNPLKPADTSSPRATLKSFQETFQEMYRRFYSEGRAVRHERERRALASRALRCFNLPGKSQVLSATKRRASSTSEMALSSWDIDFGMNLPLEITNYSRPSDQIRSAWLHLIFPTTCREKFLNNPIVLSSIRFHP